MPLAPAVLEVNPPASPEQERRFFSKLRLPNGTWKTTYRHRLDDLNDLVLGLLPEGRELELMDVAISSGISTAEWSEQLKARGVRHRILGGDLVVGGRLTTIGNWLALVSDESGREPLLLEVGELSLPLRSARRVVKVARPLLVPLLRALTAARSRPVFLVSAEARQTPEIEVVQDDVMRGGRFEGRFDVVRAANLVQRSYFDDATLRRVIANLRERVREGGLLVLCQTVGEENAATVFRRQGDQLVPVAGLGEGIDVRDLALAA
jgi:hypothetical protein